MSIQPGMNYTRGETINTNLFLCLVDEINWIDEESEKEKFINISKQINDWIRVHILDDTL
jgi:hypothetical protein